LVERLKRQEILSRVKQGQTVEEVAGYMDLAESLVRAVVKSLRKRGLLRGVMVIGKRTPKKVKPPRKELGGRTDGEPEPLGADGVFLDKLLCQWISGDPKVSWRQCGHPTVHRTPWCEHHLRRCYHDPEDFLRSKERLTGKAA
jgi:hypothetical protein